MRRALWLAAGVGLSLLAATQRFGDSAHAMGMLTAKGGRVRHPVHLAAGKQSYMLIITATVLPPYRGDARVVVEAACEPQAGPQPEYELHASAPVLDLGLRRHPRLEADVLWDLRPRDRVALWVKLKPPAGEGRYNVVLYDRESSRPVLTVPIVIGHQEQEHAGRS